MDKKDIYEHLAKIYLDASSKKKKRNKGFPKLLNNLFVIAIFFSVAVGAALFSHLNGGGNLNPETALILLHDPAKLNFNFDPAKKETYTLNLNRLNLTQTKALGFSLRNMHPKDTVSLRVEFSNAFKEKSEVYIKNVPGKWQDFKIGLTEFKNIHDWSEMQVLIFTVEEWNATQKKGVVYIDNIRLLK